MKPLVLYHGNCTDGFGAAFAAWMWFGAGAEYRPINYGEPLPGNGDLVNRQVYVLDFSFSREDMERLFALAGYAVWLDHHKTAFETFDKDPAQRWDEERYGPHGASIRLRNDQSGALIAWEYFHGADTAPLLIQHIDDRDRWQFRLPGTREMHEGLQAVKPWTFEHWSQLVQDPGAVVDLKRTGEVLLTAFDRRVAELMNHGEACYLWDPAGEEVKGIAINAGPDVASELGNKFAQASGTYGLVWHVGRDHQINCSLRSVGDFDVSAIAKRYGGGGHKNAAGFRVLSILDLAEILDMEVELI